MELPNVIPCPVDDCSGIDSLTEPDGWDWWCGRCGGVVEPVCGGDCACCNYGDCACWEEAWERHSDCRSLARLRGGVYVCSAGHVTEPSPAWVMVVTGQKTLL